MFSPSKVSTLQYSVHWSTIVSLPCFRYWYSTVWEQQFPTSLHCNVAICTHTHTHSIHVMVHCRRTLSDIVTCAIRTSPSLPTPNKSLHRQQTYLRPLPPLVPSHHKSPPPHSYPNLSQLKTRLPLNLLCPLNQLSRLNLHYCLSPIFRLNKFFLPPLQVLYRNQRLLILRS